MLYSLSKEKSAVCAGESTKCQIYAVKKNKDAIKSTAMVFPRFAVLFFLFALN
jgi:hypothetical protein